METESESETESQSESEIRFRNPTPSRSRSRSRHGHGDRHGHRLRHGHRPNFVACAVKNRNVDPHRIFTMGCSAGGLMAAAMAAQRSSYIAAASPNSGGWAILQVWQNDHTPALMTVHGMAGSDVVIVDFAQTSATADMAFKMHGGFVIDCDTGGGHCGGGGLAGDAWTFFQNHPFGADPEPWASGLLAGFSAQCKIQ